MSIDYVHDLQHVFRKILHSTSRPGTISYLSSIEEEEPQTICYSSTWLTILTLLDAEVTYHITPSTNRDLAEKISSYTLAKPASMETADYIICLQTSTDEENFHIMKQCNNGTLVDPHQGATWIIEVESLTDGDKDILVGPGIREQASLATGLSLDFIEARNNRMKEFPLGIEIILTDKKGQIACIPRTTIFKNRED